MPKLERRMYGLEIRATDDEQPKITGHAAVFNSLSEEMWGFREIIEPEAFKDAIKKSDVRALWNHDPNYVLGRTKAKTLSLREDDKGLYVEIEPPDTQWAKDLLVSMRRGDVTQMSFGFTIASDRWETKNKENIRYIEKVDRLYDVSPVTYPAYPETDVSARSMLEEIGIEWDKVNGVFVRRNAGLELSDADKELIKRSIDLLKSVVPAETAQEPQSQGAEGKPVEGVQGDLDALRKMRLELAKRMVV